MLSNLRVSNLALVEEADVAFEPGLNVFTGETGAGKTVLVGAIGLLLGDRADTAMVRTGSGQAVLEAAFDLSGRTDARDGLIELGYLEAEESELILGRRIPAEGKGRCTVNGRAVPASALSEIGSLLVEIHGQNTHQALLSNSSHLGYLDRFAGPSHLNMLDDYRRAYVKLKELEAERNALLRDTADSGRREDRMLAHEVEEIDAARPEEGEIEKLEGLAVRMRRSRELLELAVGAEGAIKGEVGGPNASELLARAAADALRMAGIDPALESLSARMESLSIEAGDIASELASYREALDLDPAGLDRIESRLSLLKDLCRKYGGSLEAVSSYRDAAAAALEEREEASRRAGRIEEEIAEARAVATRIAGSVSESRAKAGAALEEAVMGQMDGLQLGSAGFGVSLSSRGAEDRLADSGVDECEFLFSPGPGEPLKPLRRIASGGETSRVMLAIKIVLAEADRLPVLVFDEVDSGIGGETAGAVAEKLYELAGYHQVFCVTHLAPIACLADSQYVVARAGEGAGRTEVRRLAEVGRVDEICRMLGDSSRREATGRHAEDMLARAEASRSSIARRNGSRKPGVR